MSLALTNVRDLRLTFVLTHEYFCDAQGACECLPRIPSRWRASAVLSLAPGETVRNVSGAVLTLPAIEQAIRRGRLRLTRTP